MVIWETYVKSMVDLPRLRLPHMDKGGEEAVQRYSERPLPFEVHRHLIHPGHTVIQHRVPPEKLYTLGHAVQCLILQITKHHLPFRKPFRKTISLKKTFCKSIQKGSVSADTECALS